MRSEHRALALLLPVAALLSFSGQFNHALWTPDEPRVAEIGRAMLASGDYLVPRLGTQPFLEKPPLYWWTQTLAYRMFGVSDGVARLPSAVFGFLTVLLTYDMARRLAGERAGVMAACALMTTVGFHNMHRTVTDPALAFFVALGYWAFQRAALRAGHPRPDARWLLLVYLAGGLAFLSKGIVAIGLLFGPLVLYVAASGRWSLLHARAHLTGGFLLAGLCALWPVLLHLRGGRELLDPFLIDNVLGRFLSGDFSQGGHKRPPTYYLTSGPPELLPWLLVLPGLWLSLWRQRRTSRSAPEGLGFFAWVLPAGLLLLSIPSTKRSLYLLPLLAPMAVSVGTWLSMQGSHGGRDAWTRLGLRAVLVLSVLLLGAMLLAGSMLLALRAGLPLGLEPAIRHQLGSASPHLAGLLIVAAAACLVFLTRELRRRGPSAHAAIAAFCAIVLSLNVLGYRLVDPLKDLRPFVETLASHGVLDARLVGYRLDETTLALLPFYGGRTVESVEKPEALREVLRDEPGTRVLVLDKRGKGLPQDVSAGLELVVRWGLPGRRSYLVFGAPAR